LQSSPRNLPPRGKPVAGIALVLILVPGPGQCLRIGTLAEQRHQVVGIPTDLLLPFPAPAPPRDHGTAPASMRFREGILSEVSSSAEQQQCAIRHFSKRITDRLGQIAAPSA
jgi:hypothetical protein